jgi:hypothetical protein
MTTIAFPKKMLKKWRFFVPTTIFFFFLVGFSHIAHADTACPVFASVLTPQQKVICQAEYSRVLAEEKQAQAQLDAAQSESASLSRDISVLSARIKTAQLDIKAKNLLIQTLGNDISLKEKHIDELLAHIETGKQSLADSMRKIRELDSYSLPEILLSEHTVSGFLKDVDTFQSVQTGLQNTFDQLQADQASTTAERDALDVRRNSEVDARYAIQQKEASIKSDQTQKNQLLNISKGNEKAYASLKAQKEVEASQIRAALFPLAGGGQSIPFGDAYKYALEAQKSTGVRPAFLLAIFAQESSIDSSSTFGKNVGLCYLSNLNTGDGVGVNTKTPKPRTMNPTRDVPIFLNIVKSLGGDPYMTRVSCWIPAYTRGQPSGWGGAMGPAQFIPSTWSLLSDRIARALGISSAPDPWNPEHAFTAAALYLSDLGAGYGGYTAERNAACKYYSGSACGKVVGSSSYGNSVMTKANNIQTTMIDQLMGL